MYLHVWAWKAKKVFTGLGIINEVPKDKSIFQDFLLLINSDFQRIMYGDS